MSCLFRKGEGEGEGEGGGKRLETGWERGYALPYGVFLAKTLDPICVVGKQSGVLGRHAALSAKPGGSLIARSRGESVGSRGEKVTLFGEATPFGEAIPFGDVYGELQVRSGVAGSMTGVGGESSFFMNFL